eukprot:TRINITY_DN38510_c0_g1_i1.p1 TRINITY_DN38510_c0_g1~~TRINITY_DN38510_c0_g1_i1.p1  ORF type:complete len:291 (+),score=58.58 TRINITY_DN38510_c0_g1_i1:87-959(+)
MAAEVTTEQPMEQQPQAALLQATEQQPQSMGADFGAEEAAEPGLVQRNTEQMTEGAQPMPAEELAPAEAQPEASGQTGIFYAFPIPGYDPSLAQDQYFGSLLASSAYSLPWAGYSRAEMANYTQVPASYHPMPAAYQQTQSAQAPVSYRPPAHQQSPTGPAVSSYQQALPASYQQAPAAYQQAVPVLERYQQQFPQTRSFQPSQQMYTYAQQVPSTVPFGQATSAGSQATVMPMASGTVSFPYAFFPQVQQTQQPAAVVATPDVAEGTGRGVEQEPVRTPKRRGVLARCC